MLLQTSLLIECGAQGSRAVYANSADFLGMAALMLAQNLPVQDSTAICAALPRAAYEANARLTYDQFDQQQATPWVPRSLTAKQCFAQAADVTENYLMNAPNLGAREKRNLTFHMMQYLSFSGAPKRDMARLTATTLWTEQPADTFLDWNTYVRGTWAFFAGDREALTQAHATLSQLKGDGDQVNAAVLAG